MTGAALVQDQAGATREATRPASIILAGQTIHALSEAETIEYVLDSLDAGRSGWIVTVNLDILRRLSRDESYRELVRDADLFVPDGMPLIWASRLQGTALRERVAGSNMVSSLTGAASERGRSVYLLGGDEGVAEKAAATLRERFPAARIAGVECPPFGFDRDEAQMAGIRSRLEAAGPDIVYVALGCPKQDRVIRALRSAAPNAWWMGVGISFSFLCGEVQRAPLWMQRLGLEWVHRLWQEPGRLARRYLIDDLPFALRLLTGAALSRLSPFRPRSEEQR